MSLIRVAAFTKYDREAASTRQRVLQYCPALRDAGIEVHHFPLLSDDYVREIATGEKSSRLAIAAAYGRRIRQLLAAQSFDVLWIYAELFPYLPATFEKLASVRGKPIVYDFDDAFFQPYDDHPRTVVRRMLSGKLKPLLGRAAACCCGNQYLRDYARPLCANSIVVPTVVDTDKYRPAVDARTHPLTIGWIGSPSTWVNVRPLLPVLEQAAKEHDARIRVVGAGVAGRNDRSPYVDFVDWNEDREVADVQAMDVGIMPLLDLPFQRGKSGYKIVQYMACGLPVVASPVGVNSTILRDGETGFLASTSHEWAGALDRLLRDGSLRERLGQAGRARAVESYSLASQTPRLIEVFRSAAAERGG